MTQFKTMNVTGSVMPAMLDVRQTGPRRISRLPLWTDAMNGKMPASILVRSGQFQNFSWRLRT